MTLPAPGISLPRTLKNQEDQVAKDGGRRGYNRVLANDTLGQEYQGTVLMFIQAAALGAACPTESLTLQRHILSKGCVSLGSLSFLEPRS